MNNTRETLIELIYKAHLSPREARVLEMRVNGNSLQIVGEEMGVQKERIRQVEAKACRKLKHPLRFGGIENRLNP